GVKIMNFARDELVVTKDLFDAIDSGIVDTYVTDFPNGEMLGREGCICIPHLGASSAEAEENCAVMVTNEIVDYLKNGTILNSVNFPGCSLERSGKNRIIVTAKNNKDTSETLKSALQNTIPNITGTANESRGDISYTIIDSDEEVHEDKLEQLRNIKDVIKVRSVS
ncbi:MAG: 3-phosphoglycerate dehydrogenase, partial [Candidatus Anammoxibacter sp.]